MHSVHMRCMMFETINPIEERDMSMLCCPGWINLIIKFCDAHQGFCMVLLTAALALCAIISCLLAYKNIKALKENEVERARPIVILEIVPDLPFYIVRMKNTGRTAARNITIEIDPPLKYCFERWVGKTIGFFNRSVDFFPPDYMLQTSIGSFRDIERNNPSLIYNGTLRYEDVRGRHYEDAFTLDFSLFNDMVFSGKKTINDIGAEMEKIRRALELFGNGFNKLRVIAQDLDDYREEESQFVKSAMETINEQKVESEVNSETDGNAKMIGEKQ